MADATGRALALVARQAAKDATTGQAQFAARVQEVLAQHGDIALEATWQDLSRVIVEQWLLLCGEQAPIATWQMLGKCTETILKVRRAGQQGQAGSADEALEAFRDMMQQVLEGEDET